MIITLEHEDIETALLSWMNESGMSASPSTTSIVWTKSRKTGRMTAVVNPNGKLEAEAATGNDAATDPVDPTGTEETPGNHLFGKSA